MRFPRAAGILLHPTSLPGRFGIGDLGDSALEFCSQLAAAGQTYWQMLPLGPTGYGDSPYQSLSAFAGNILLISPESLVGDGWLTADEILPPDLPTDRVDYAAVTEWKEKLLHTAFSAFEKSQDRRDEFGSFCGSEAYWLDDYALYRALKSSNGEAAWFQWSDGLKLRDQTTLDEARSQQSREIHFHKFCQWQFFRQWRLLHEHAAATGIKIIGDIPIFTALDSADVWARRDLFKLNTDGGPIVVAGVPPDYFSKTGQLWGNPIYNWDAMLSDDFAWWRARFAATLKLVDLVRIDHFRGFVSAWEVPAGDQTAENGQWVEVPGRELFTALGRHLGELPVIAEDLGAITPEVNALRDEFGFPGMRILEYGFGGDAYNRDLPHNYEPHTVAYTGTHDNDTAIGWFASLDEKTRTHASRYLVSTGDEINCDMIRSLYASVADTVIIPLQDILGLDSPARMNTPATTSGNWQWRMEPGSLDPDICERLSELTVLYGRERKDAVSPGRAVERQEG